MKLLMLYAFWAWVSHQSNAFLQVFQQSLPSSCSLELIWITPVGILHLNVSRVSYVYDLKQ